MESTCNAAAAHFSAAVASPTHQASRRRPPGASVFYIDLPVLWDLETDGLAAAIRNDRSPLQRYILKNKQIPGSPAWLCELVPVQKSSSCMINPAAESSDDAGLPFF
jgi:hypothetical protein